MKTNNLIIIILSVLVIATSCKKDDEDIIVIEPTLKNISPTSGSKETVVTINGNGFETNTDNIKVFFNNTETNVLSITENQITAEVPRLAMTGIVKVISNGKELIGPEFTYLFSEAHVSTLAGNKEEGGNVDGQGDNARLGAMDGIVIDMEGNLNVIEPFNNTIRKISPDGLVNALSRNESGYEDGSLNTAKFSTLRDIAIDAEGNKYISDTNNNRIRKISASGIVSTIAGGWQGYEDGPGTEAKFFLPSGITTSKDGNIYVADSGLNHSRVRKITPDGHVSTVAGGEIGYADGQGEAAKFTGISGMAVDASGNILIADSGNHKIRKISPEGLVTTLAGSTMGYADGNTSEAQFNIPYDLTLDKLGNIYVADYSNMRIRKISIEGIVTTIAGDGSYGFLDGEGLNAKLAFPRAIVVDEDFNLFVTQNFVVRKISQE